MTRFRPLLRLSLLTLFVLMTELCVGLGWLAWQWQIVREREELATWIEERDGVVWAKIPGCGHELPKPPNTQGLNSLRIYFGDYNRLYVRMPPVAASARARAVRDFPEAMVAVERETGEVDVIVPTQRRYDRFPELPTSDYTSHAGKFTSSAQP